MDEGQLNLLCTTATQAIEFYQKGQMPFQLDVLYLASGVNELISEVRELRERNAKLERLLDAHFPNWKKAAIWDNKPWTINPE